jgi:hypothetical protein
MNWALVFMMYAWAGLCLAWSVLGMELSGHVLQIGFFGMGWAGHGIF